jgi:hypothetical protein
MGKDGRVTTQKTTQKSAGLQKFYLSPGGRMFLSDGTFNRNTRLEIWNFLFHPKPPLPNPPDMGPFEHW